MTVKSKTEEIRVEYPNVAISIYLRERHMTSVETISILMKLEIVSPDSLKEFVPESLKEAYQEALDASFQKREKDETINFHKAWEEDRMRCAALFVHYYKQHLILYREAMQKIQKRKREEEMILFMNSLVAKEKKTKEN